MVTVPAGADRVVFEAGVVDPAAGGGAGGAITLDGVVIKTGPCR